MYALAASRARRRPLAGDPEAGASWSDMIPEAIVEGLRSARHIAVLTGAGVSAESGIPTFRDALTGLWSRYRAEDLATPEAFARDPKLVWEWYAWRRDRVAAARPNPAHEDIARMESLVPALSLVTQNVDGLHQRAGSADVIELHGNIMRTRCSRDGRIVESWPNDDVVPPHCPSCGAPLRPDVVWFGEILPEEALRAAHAAATACDWLLVVGTSGLVYPAAALPLMALGAGVPVIVIDPNPVELASRRGTVFLQGPAARVVPELVETVWPV